MSNGFKSTPDQWREISGKLTKPKTNFLTIEKNMFDLIQNDGFYGKVIEDIDYDKINNIIILKYSDASTRNIVLNSSGGGGSDIFLSDVIFDVNTKIITLTMSDSDKFYIDLKPLVNNFYNKSEVDDKITNINNINWKNF